MDQRLPTSTRPFAHASLEAVLGFANTVVVGAACAHVPVTGAMVGDDDLISDPEVRSQICTSLAELACGGAACGGLARGQTLGPASMVTKPWR